MRRLGLPSGVRPSIIAPAVRGGELRDQMPAAFLASQRIQLASATKVTRAAAKLACELTGCAIAATCPSGQ
jgi:hypothetical protein